MDRACTFRQTGMEKLPEDQVGGSVGEQQEWKTDGQGLPKLFKVFLFFNVQVWFVLFGLWSLLEGEKFSLLS